MKNTGFLAIVFALLLSACSGQTTVWEDPVELFSAVEAAVTLPPMVDLAADYLEDSTGISPDSYESAVYYLLEEGTAPDEIIIVKAKDETAAADILQKLEKRLAYKEKSAQSYLTEYMPVIEDGVVRQDGLLISLIVSEHVDAILEVYRNPPK